MSNKKFTVILMAFVAMSVFKPSFSFAETKSPPSNTFKIKTPNTKNELAEDKSVSTEDEREESQSSQRTSGASRKLNQHGLGIGLGETFLLGNFAKYGQDKITTDLFYSYAASYSFDLLLNAHISEHKDKSDRMKLMGLTSSIKARFVEFDSFSPYFLGGLGFYSPQAKRVVNGDNQWSDRKITFGLNFGGGFDLRLNDHYVVGLLGQMHCPFQVKQDQGSNIKGYYFKLLITAMYLF